MLQGINVSMDIIYYTFDVKNKINEIHKHDEENIQNINTIVNLVVDMMIDNERKSMYDKINDLNKLKKQTNICVKIEEETTDSLKNAVAKRSIEKDEEWEKKFDEKMEAIDKEERSKKQHNDSIISKYLIPKL